MTGNLTLSSTFLLTLLLSVGLMFFIKASIKERIETLEFTPNQDAATIAQQLQDHFQQRAYKLVSPAATAPTPTPIEGQSHDQASPGATSIVPPNQTLVFEGFVAPSWFLAIFLSGLAAVGFLCIALVLAISLPRLSWLWFSLPLLSPLAGVFYWRGAKRPEQVSFIVSASSGSAHPQVSVTGHRDELTALRQAFRIPRSE